jgi:hypothetical protein
MKTEPRKRTKLGLGLAATVVLVAVLAAAQAPRTSAAPGDNAVVQWSGIAEAALAAGRSPASSTVLAGMVHGAMYDAVAAVEGGLEPFVTDVTAPPGTSAEAAVAQAAHDVLVSRVPAQAGTVQAAFDAYLAAVPAGPAKQAGTEVGAAAAAGMLAARLGDHYDDVVPYTQRTPGPGVFEPVAASNPVDTKLGAVRPFTYGSPADVRPDAPYALTSKRYAADLDELVRLGGATGSEREDAQTSTVRFFSDNTFVQYSRALRGLVSEQGLDVVESARLMGYVHVAQADTMISCFEAKYHYMFWRPVHAIARADTDGNPATAPVAGWASLLVVNHPEYPSGHGCYTAALTEALRGYFKTKHVSFTVSSTTSGAGPARTYDRLDDLVDDVEDARVWGGLHYRTTMQETAKDFPRIARDIGQRYFLRTAH